MTDHLLPDLEAALYLSPRAERLSGLGCFEWDIRSNKVSWSDGLFQIFGLPPQESDATLKAFVDRVVEEDRERVREAVRTAIENCGDFSFIHRIRHHSGEIRYLESKGEVVVGEVGQPGKLVLVCRDVTVQKKLELRFQDCEKMEAMGRLAAGVAHDFNNLLTVININSELLMSHLKAESGLEFAAGIKEAADRASELTSQLLLFGRQRKSRQVVFSVDDHVRDSKSFLSSLIGDRIELTTELNSDSSCIKIDPSHLDQVLMNLAVNSHDAMPTGGELTIGTSLIDVEGDAAAAMKVKPGKYVEMVVQDTGVGMGPGECERALDPFYSDNNTGGTGLGLAVVQGVVSENGGMIQLASQLGVGTSCRVLFPVHEPVAKVTEHSERDGKADVARKRILLVDDDPMVLKAAKFTLQRIGCEVFAVESGQEALDLLGKVDGEIDLLVSDVSMPAMTGPELAEMVRAKFSTIPVLFMSGYADDLRSKVDRTHLIAKPFTMSTLRDRLKQMLL